MLRGGVTNRISYTRGDQGVDSDVDLLVELGDALGLPVDLVEREALRPRIAAQVLAEVVPV